MADPRRPAAGTPMQAMLAAFPTRPLRLRQSGMAAMLALVPVVVLVLIGGLVLYQLVDLLAGPPPSPWRLLVFAGLMTFAALVVWGGLRARRVYRAQQAIVRALSGQALQPVALQGLKLQSNSWRLAAAEGGPGFDWQVPRTFDRPFVLDHARRQVLGVRTAGVPQPMPLDAALRWIDLTDAERERLLTLRDAPLAKW